MDITPASRLARRYKRLTRKRFIKLAARLDHNETDAKIAYNALVKYVARHDDRRLDVYCGKCGSTYGRPLCKHFSTVKGSPKRPPVIDPGSLVGFVADAELRDIKSIGRSRKQIILDVVEALKVQT